MINDEEINNIIPKKIDLSIDLKNNFDLIKSQVINKNCLIIGGAGTIGSNYIKQLLIFKPRLLIVVDINENGLTIANITIAFIATVGASFQYL